MKFPRRFGSGAFRPALQSEGADPLEGNPSRGWYLIDRLRLAEDMPAPALNPSPYALTLLEVDLSAYRDAPLDERALARLDAALAAVDAAGKRAVLRFVYDLEGQCWRNEPQKLESVLEHMRALSPVLRARAAQIYTLQGVFVGNWGEMHGSRHLTRDSVRLLAETLADASAPETPLAVRTPAFWRVCARSEAPDPAASPLAARLGLYNDALLSSPDDMGTYSLADVSGATGVERRRTPEAEAAFQNALCAHVPSGGETAADFPLNDAPAFARMLFTLRLSYLNAAYCAQVLDKWKAARCPLAGPFRGGSYYDYIGAHLGYRLVARRAVLADGQMEVSLCNVGAAGFYERVPIALVLRDDAGREVFSPVDTDARGWPTGAEIRLRAPLPENAGGARRVYLRIGSGVRLANAGCYNEIARANFLGELMRP